MNETVDYSQWPTKPQVAKRWGLSSKGVERRAKKHGVVHRLWRNPANGVRQVVYQPDQVAEVAALLKPEPLPAFLVRPPDPIAASPNGTGDHALAATGSAEAALALFVQAAARLLTQTLSQTSQTSQTPTVDLDPLCVPVERAAALLGWTARDVRAAVRRGELAAFNRHLKDWRRWTIRRVDLAALQPPMKE